jgi:hypothetical protein
MPLDTQFGSLDHNGLIKPGAGTQEDEEDLEQNDSSLKDQNTEVPEDKQESSPNEGAADDGGQPTGEGEQEQPGHDGDPEDPGQKSDEPDKGSKDDDDPAQLKQQLEEIRKERDNFKKQAANGTREFQKYQAQIKALEEQLQTVQEGQKAASLPPYDPASPKHGDFQQKIPLIEEFHRQLSTATSAEEQEAVGKRWSSTLSPEDLHAYDAYSKQQSNPDNLRQMAREEAWRANQEISAAEARRRHADQVLQENQELLAGREVELIQAMQQRGLTIDQYVAEVKAQQATSEVQELRKQLAEAQQRQKAKEEALRGKATPSRDPTVVPVQDAHKIYDEAKRTFVEKYGWNPTENIAHPDWTRHLRETEKRLTQV